MSDTNYINPRDLSDEDKQVIKDMLRWGDVGKIAINCSVGYQRVSDVLRTGEDHHQVWRKALEYLNKQSEVEIDERIRKVMMKQCIQKAKEEAA